MGSFNPFKDSWRDASPSSILEFSATTVFTGGQNLNFDAAESVANQAEKVGQGVEARTKELAGLNAQFIIDEADESIRRATLQFNDLQKQVRGIQASSGFLADTGTNVLYQERLTDAFNAEIDYINKSTESQVNIAILEGAVAGDIAKNNERAQGTGLVTDIIGIFT